MRSEQEAKQELEIFLGNRLNKLEKEKKLALTETYSQQRKTPLIYFWWFFNFHYLYVRKWWLFVLFILTFAGVGIWWVIDLFRLNTILREYNKNLAEELLTQYTSVEKE